MRGFPARVGVAAALFCFALLLHGSHGGAVEISEDATGKLVGSGDDAAGTGMIRCDDGGGHDPRFPCGRRTSSRCLGYRQGTSPPAPTKSNTKSMIRQAPPAPLF